MGVLSNNYAKIIPGALISASYVSDIYDVLLGAATESIRLNGSLTVTGSVTSTVGFYGSLIGNASTSTSASYAVNCTTASYAVTASYLLASQLITLTPSNPLPTNPLTGSFAVSSSIPPKPYFWNGTTWTALY
jgi:hypothetical protein